MSCEPEAENEKRSIHGFKEPVIFVETVCVSNFYGPPVFETLALILIPHGSTKSSR
jgi:hypothetical protein